MTARFEVLTERTRPAPPTGAGLVWFLTGRNRRPVREPDWSGRIFEEPSADHLQHVPIFFQVLFDLSLAVPAPVPPLGHVPAKIAVAGQKEARNVAGIYMDSPRL